MKKIVLMMLVAMVPFLTMAQKKAKKKQEKAEISSGINSNFMIIKGVEFDKSQEGMAQKEKDSEDISKRQMMNYIKPGSRFHISFDAGPMNTESQKLNNDSKKFRSMSQAVNACAEYGWEFINATVVIDGPVKIHYYYMKRNK